MPRKRTPRVRVCEWCGNFIGTERGPAAKTCSHECQRDRNNDREKKRYHKIKHTQAWKDARADYVERLKVRIECDPEFAQKWVEARRMAVRKYRSELEKDPERWASYQEKHRQWHHNMTPEQQENKRAQNRAWYAGLDQEFKRMFLLRLREQRALKRLADCAGDDGIP